MPRSARIAGVSVTSSISRSTATLGALTSGRSAIVTVRSTVRPAAPHDEWDLLADAEVEQRRVPVEAVAHVACADAR